MKKSIALLALLLPAAANAQGYDYPDWKYEDRASNAQSAAPEPAPRQSAYDDRRYDDRRYYDSRYDDRRYDDYRYDDRRYDDRRYSDRRYDDYRHDDRRANTPPRRESRYDTADADEKPIRMYIGLDLSKFSVGFNPDGVDEGADKVLETGHNAYTFNVGAKFKENFGVELSYKQTTTAKTKDLAYDDDGYPANTYAIMDAETSFSGIGISGSYYIPVAPKFTIEPTLGLGQYKGKMKTTVTGHCLVSGTTCATPPDTSMLPSVGTSVTQTESGSLGITLGLGASYEINENFDARLGYRMTTFSDKEFSMKDFSELFLGARYMF